MEKLEELIAALETAEGPSRELDIAIMAALFDWAKPEMPFYGPHISGEEPIYWHAPGCLQKKTAPKLTASIDAAVALVERVKPGWFWRGGNVPAGKYERGKCHDGWGHISRTDASNCDRDDEFTGWASTPALALLIATLKAKLSQEMNNAE